MKRKQSIYNESSNTGRGIETERYEDLQDKLIRTPDVDGKGRWVMRIFFYAHCPRAIFHAYGEHRSAGRPDLAPL
jgi:hypothetical protein